jgi:hypothetical protein
MAATDDIAEPLEQLHRAGWSVGVAGLATEAGRIVWVVSGRNGENLIRAEGATEAEAWRGAVEQDRSVGMAGGWRIDKPGVG